MKPKIRLCVEHPLGEGQQVALTREQAHYLFGVMRLGPGDVVGLFNGCDGEWRATVEDAGKRGGLLACQAQSGPQVMPPDLWLMFAPVKKAQTQFIVEKAVEMGARRILPVLTAFTNSERLRVDKQQAHALEAAEQCGATFVPEVAEPQRLDRLLADWEGRRILFADESAVGGAVSLSGLESGPWAVLIGPEGGFSEAERSRLRSMDCTTAISLGPRILRAETAAVAALTLWQHAAGDWRKGEGRE
ncbi:16S rRNA (uracil(1498)-N(3))-methyltransferase [Ponticoccus alexandrii]|uniref:Ribosomal RNA small subunit methyltransferase E n=1 Tax=Ponticoccus alexandrii TaxID=1943633 RepID=A0ABX7F5M1_9RHOB|nr:16S rRNA (uracil(1498)-N(3))-methyltransferase [Ponticoccus alexandrii]ETA52404.2 16S rRNA methyltransferase [Rhodobacteraceae bacterium PD-2]QRF65414.1 16S rRNA (uracil(1498)-N(3))-methyltransferase [Ponticoccus alexandrii]